MNSDLGMKTPVVLTPMVQVYKTHLHYEMTIVCRDGSIVEHEPFKNDLEGLVSALSLCAEICAGKFYLKSVKLSAAKKLEIESSKK